MNLNPIVDGAAGAKACVGGAAPAQSPHDNSGIAFPTEAARREIARWDEIGDREVGDSDGRGVAGKSGTSNQDMIANCSIRNIGSGVEDGNWVESSSVEYNEFAPLTKF